MSLYGKIFGSMYQGSMVGKGAMVFALMGYVIANMRVSWVGVGRKKEVTDGFVTLNTKILAATFGEPETAIRAGIDVLTAPDPESRSKDAEGRRLLKIGEFEYRVVNAAYYQNLKDEEDQREKNRLRQQKFRDGKTGAAMVVLTGKDAEKYDEARGKSYHRRRKVAEHAGICHGAQEAIAVGLAENGNGQ
jgi:hypothetical protein